MCGIIGSVGISINSDLLSYLSHRGPDGTGLIDLKIGNKLVSFGHTRLAIVELTAAGNQPMSTDDRNHLITFNGEIYNHCELRCQLGDVSFHGHSDTETVMNLLAKKGIRSVREFNGIFAFAFLEVEKKKLYLARDPFGVKPLYYSLQKGKFVFSSEIRPIQRLLPDSLDRQHLSELLRLRYVPSPDTIYKNIKKVRPGHIVEVDLDSDFLRIKEFPFVDGARDDLSSMSFMEASKQYGDMLETAVQKQLMSDVEVGVLLSGGIDSALIAQKARSCVPYRMKAFTVGFAGQSDADEIDQAKSTADLLGLEHHVVRINDAEFFNQLEKCVQIVEEPLATTSIVPMFHLAELASRHVKVVLSGQGADEPLGGYGRYQAELWHQYVPPWLAKMLGSMDRGLGLKNEKLRRGLGSLSQKNDIDRFLFAYEIFNRGEISGLIGVEEVLARDRIKDMFELLHCKDFPGSVKRMMAIDMRMNLADDLLLYTDKITMHHSLECRVPMLDLELIRFLESIPASFRIRLGKTKIIHRHYAAQALSQEIIRRRKKGFSSPTREWFLKEGIVDDILLDPSSQFANIFDLKEVKKILTQHRLGLNREKQLFLLLSIRYCLDNLSINNN